MYIPCPTQPSLSHTWNTASEILKIYLQKLCLRHLRPPYSFTFANNNTCVMASFERTLQENLCMVLFQPLLICPI